MAVSALRVSREIVRIRATPCPLEVPLRWCQKPESSSVRATTFQCNSHRTETYEDELTVEGQHTVLEYHHSLLKSDFLFVSLSCHSSPVLFLRVSGGSGTDWS